MIHIRRHGIDVALSLMNRAEGRARSRRISHRPVRAYHFAGAAHSELYDGRFASLHNGLSLWDEYQTSFDRYRAAGLAGKQVIELDYERLLNNPAETAEELIRNLGLTGAVADDIGSTVNPDRAFAWTRSEDARLKQLLSQHREDVGELLSRHGYGLDDTLFRSVDNT